jgi:hypothetical protein
MNCEICGKPVVLVPSAAERAAKYGGTPESYTAKFPTHVDCFLAKRKKDTSELIVKRSAPMDQLDKMIEWEQGTLNEDDTVALFQELVNSGLAWQLQGCYGRQAMALINAGLVTRP